MTDKVVVLVTCKDSAEGKRIGRALVERRLAACVNQLEMRVRSTYRWKGKVEEADERLLLVKSSRRLLPALQAEVERLHSYDVPEVIAVPIAAGSRSYLSWLAECLRPAPSARHRGLREGRARRARGKKQ